MEEIRERAIFETASGGYVLAEDTGYFSVGDIREEGVYKLSFRPLLHCPYAHPNEHIMYSTLWPVFLPIQRVSRTQPRSSL